MKIGAAELKNYCDDRLFSHQRDIVTTLNFSVL